MKFTVTIELILSQARNPLLNASSILSEHEVVPDLFVWSMIPDTHEARIWMQLETDEARLEALAGALRVAPSTARVVVQHEPSLTTPPESREGLPASGQFSD